MLPRRLASTAALLLLAAALARAAPPVFTYQIVARYPHAATSYTEGLFYLDGLFYEGTGLNGHSSLLVLDPRTGRPVQHVDLPPQYFGEGIVDFGSNLYQWTWQSHLCFVYDRFTLRLLRTLPYPGEGWGMTRTATQIVTSDGSATLTFRDPATFRETRHIIVHDGSRRIDQLNELEFVHGEIYANVWHTDRIARIAPTDGHITAWIDLTGILPESQKQDAESVLNGIAYDPQHDRLFVTGKQWPILFEIKLIPR